MLDDTSAPTEVTSTPAQTLDTSVPDNLGSGFEDLLKLDPGEGADGGAPETPAEPAAPAQRQAPAQTPVQPQTAQQAQRASREPKLAKIVDTGLKSTLSQMSNAAFDKFYPIALRLQDGELIEKEQLEKTIADREREWTEKASNTRFLDHEHGYKLTPEYQELETAAQSNSAEASFWEDQLVNIRQGQPVRKLLADSKGNVHISEFSIDPKEDPSIEAYVLGKIAKAQGISQVIQDKMRGLPERHKTEFGRFNSTVTDLNTQLFGALSKNEQFTKAAEAEIAGIPAALRGRPEIKLLGNALAAGKMLLAQNAKLNEQLAQHKKIRSSRAGGAPDPTDNLPPDSTEEGDVTADLALLNRMAA
jgi:hypothetical protein